MHMCCPYSVYGPHISGKHIYMAMSKWPISENLAGNYKQTLQFPFDLLTECQILKMS